MDYKETLLLPKTSFPMRGNLPSNEPKRYKKWFSEKVYERMKENRRGEEKFNLHDGPPYANGHIHIGHALNKILKDIVNKFYYFQGYDIRFVPGWDCHGLPIEQQVEKKIGREKKEKLPKTKIRELCREHAAKFIDIQREEFKSLGVIGDWDNPYKTMDFEFEADIFKALGEIAKRGLLVERSKPVFWCMHDKTALAEAEVEYYDKEDYSIYVAFPLSKEANKVLGTKHAKIIIWTTTPWTLPANMGIAINPEVKYVLTSDNFIVAKPLYEKLKEEGVVSGEIVKEFEPKELEGLKAVNPLNNRLSVILLGEHVTMDGGTGCVHTAPGHGEEDYRVWRAYGYEEILQPVGDDGRYSERVKKEKLLPDEFVGMHIFEANEKILKLLGENLIKVGKFTHSYPHCWRCKNPIIFRATKQFFIAMDKEYNNSTLREKALKEIEKVKFTPSSGKNRLKTMVSNRPDWCISRQRDWGVPIAFFRDKRSGELIIDDEMIEHIYEIFKKEGADAWYSKSIEELLPESKKEMAKNLEKVEDILDVWFDSGSTWFAVLKSNRYDAGEYPASMYLEGSDQHRGWFQSSLLVSTAIEEKAPYKSILTHGFTVDESGRKMSKSEGNVVAPSEVAKKYGTEILRLWVGVSDYSSDIKLGENILKQVAEQYRKIRNTIRFLLANVNDLEEIKLDNPGIIDKWILSRSKEVFDEVVYNFNKYDFSKAMQILNNFIVSELSAIYLDVCKDRLYCEAKDSPKRRNSQSTMAIILKELLPLIAPILTYTADEAIEHSPKVIKEDAKDIFDFVYTPLVAIENPIDEEVLEIRRRFYEIVDRLKKEKVIKDTLELAIETNYDKLLKDEMAEFFGVSLLCDEVDGEVLDEIHIDEGRFVLKVKKSPFYKCPRCWRYLAKSEGELCDRCKEVVNG
ncbi:MAG: isoleucine--tRNA ligase [Nautiliaceae bacterium]